MKKGNIVKFSAATMVALSAITPVAAFASEAETPAGFYTGSTFLSQPDFQKMTKQEKKAFLAENIKANALVLVLNGKVYDMTNEEIQKAPANEVEGLGKTVEQYTAETGNKLTPNGIETSESTLTVTSVSAISGKTIAANTATELKFLVNGKEELTAKEFEEKYEGYTVAFKYNKSTAGYGADGKVNVAAGTFKYAVQVEDAEGNLIPEEVTAADFVEVKAVAADKAVAVNEIGLVADGKAWTQSVLDGKVSIAATKYVNALGQDQDATDANEEKIVTVPAIKSVKSSDVTIAYWDATSQTIKVLNDGKVTFTVEFEGIEAKSTISFDAKAAQKIGSVVTEDAKVAAGEATVSFKVLDQDGEAYLGSEKLYTVKNAAGTTSVAKAKTPASGKVSITETFAKGDNTVTIYADEAGKEKLGTFKVNAVDVTDALPDSYTLSFADEKVTSLDLNVDKDASSLDISVKAFIDGIEVAANKGLTEEYKLVAKSSNKNVPVSVGNIADGKLTVSLPENAKVGTATVDLYTVEGQLETKVATINVEVKNTTPKFTTLTLKKDTKVDATKEDLKAAVISAVVEGALEEGALEAKHIASVTPVKDNGVVIVKIDNLYGGALITLAATFEAEKPVDPQPVTPLTITVDSAVEASVFADKEFTVGDTTATIAAGEEGKLVITFANKTVGEEEVAITEEDIAAGFEIEVDGTTYTVSQADGAWTLVEKTPEV